MEEEEETPTNDDGDDESDREVSSSEFKSDGGDESANEEELFEIEHFPCDEYPGCMAWKKKNDILFLRNEFLKLNKMKGTKRVAWLLITSNPGPKNSTSV